jgi:hypothetical protein
MMMMMMIRLLLLVRMLLLMLLLIMDMIQVFKHYEILTHIVIGGCHHQWHYQRNDSFLPVVHIHDMLPLIKARRHPIVPLEIRTWLLMMTECICSHRHVF